MAEKPKIGERCTVTLHGIQTYGIYRGKRRVTVEFGNGPRTIRANTLQPIRGIKS